jgi:hypothetical protein
LFLGGCPRDMGLKVHRLGRATVGPERLHDRSEPLRRLIDRDEGISPAGDEGGSSTPATPGTGTSGSSGSSGGGSSGGSGSSGSNHSSR